MFKLLIQKKFW